MMQTASISNESLSRVKEWLYAEADQPGVNCKPKPKPRSTEQQQATQQAQQVSQQQGQTFDQMPQQQVQEMGRQGGQAERKPSLPECSK